ncbi:MAG: D-alanyl-D-alanine carboxypeptidase/D-alanyl-D-alanine-endopeptidase [Campylobacterota bacterium]|nr:D-alanyl-D-alanine carboxypeptidase/D-alanyl-D-alanine-endopeptidase [Campylobacterota bacterium]
MNIKKLMLVYILLSVSVWALPNGINTLIRNSGVPAKDVSIYIKQINGNGGVLASLNANTTRTPASVVKVFTTYASILKLGFNYRFPTKFYMKGKFSKGILNGDLIVKGMGDPSLSSGDLKHIVKQVKSRGIKKITGNIVIDRSYFDVGNKNTSGFDKNTHSPYNAMPDAMMFNERISTVCVTPNKNSVTKKNADGSYQVINKLKRVNKPCRGKYSWPAVQIDSKGDKTKIWLKGAISKRCGKRNICKVVTKPYKSFYYALKESLNKAGVKVRGTMRLAKVPKHAKPLFTHYSEPLEEIISKTAKKSNNVYARQLLLVLGAKTYGAPATLHKGQRALERILDQQGALASGVLRIDNGSGLSRTAKMSARQLSKMLEHAHKRYGKKWMDTLSIAGVDGTIKKRFQGSVAKSRAWMKTGTLRRVKNIGGYVKSKSGHLYAVTILVNTNKGNWRAAGLQNDIIKWLVRYKGKSLVKKITPLKKITRPMPVSSLWSIETKVPKEFVEEALLDQEMF